MPRLRWCRTRRGVGLGAALLLGLACAPAATPPAPGPAPAAPMTPAADPLAPPWVVEPGRALIAQALRLDATIISRVDSVERVDTARSELRLEWSRVSGDGAPRLSGLLTDFRVSRDRSAPVPLPGLMLPIPIAAIDEPGALAPRITRPDQAGCGLDAAASLGVRELLVSLPRRLEPGTAWTDSARYVICRDSIPLTVESVRSFRAVGAERGPDGVVVTVERTSRVSMRGEGTQFGEAITIAAEGAGRALLRVRLDGGYIAGGEGESELQMTMRGRRRSQELTQRTRILFGAP